MKLAAESATAGWEAFASECRDTKDARYFAAESKITRSAYVRGFRDALKFVESHTIDLARAAADASTDAAKNKTRIDAAFAGLADAIPFDDDFKRSSAKG